MDNLPEKGFWRNQSMNMFGVGRGCTVPAEVKHNNAHPSDIRILSRGYKIVVSMANNMIRQAKHT